jgi:hypothetical protein
MHYIPTIAHGDEAGLAKESEIISIVFHILYLHATMHSVFVNKSMAMKTSLHLIDASKAPRPGCSWYEWLVPCISKFLPVLFVRYQKPTTNFLCSWNKSNIQGAP